MRQVFLEKGLIQLKEVAEPVLEKNMIMVSVHYSCISPGTEQATINNAQQNPLFTSIPQKISKVLQSFAVHGIEGTKALVKEKLQGSLQTLGYSCSGRVIAVGSGITRFRAGDFVACAGAGFAHHASIIVVPENLTVLLSNKTFLKEASTTTLGAIALQGIRRANIQLGETVCIIGLGLLGQLSVQLAKQSGAFVIGVDLIQERLSLAQSLGADVIINAQEDTKNIIDYTTSHYGVDATIITAASKSDTIIQQAMEITRKKGRVVLVGDVGLNIERSPFYQKEIDFLISCSYGPGRYDQSYENNGIDYPYAYVRWTENRNMKTFVSLLEQKKITVEPLVPSCFDVDDVEIAYKSLKEQQALGALLSYEKYHAAFAAPEQSETTKNHSSPAYFTPAQHEKVRVGVIGAGGFAKVKLMPILSKINSLKINAIVDANITSSLTVSKLYNAQKTFTDNKSLYDENVVDAVVISSPHKYHCDQALTALQNGKAVFLEKPMVTDFEQLNSMHQFLSTNNTTPFCVDYNRAFAPYIKKIKDELNKRKSPVIILYRMNAGFIPRDHWVQTDVGAGRIIGEACHIIDLFYYLVGSPVTSVSVESLKPADVDLLPTDNFSTQLSFTDGSVCTLVYTALGHSKLGKERMELYFDSKSIVMDDYKTLQGFGLPASFNESTKNPDKGHEALLKTFFATLHTCPYQPPIAYKRLQDVAQLTLIIDKLASKGGGSQDFDSL